MDKIVALAKRRGFIFPGSEIYGGLAGTWDYGPLGVELKNNIKREFWQAMVGARSDTVGLDAAILMNPRVWEASGHVEAFTDPLVECKICHHRFRADQLGGLSMSEIEEELGKSGTIMVSEVIRSQGADFQKLWRKCLECGAIIKDEPKQFNLLVEARLGAVEGRKSRVYLRGEITQGVHTNFRNVLDTMRPKVPFGVVQIGKAFRNEITPGNFTFRSREFEQMELQWYVKPEEREAMRWFEYWKEERMRWYTSLGMREEHLRFREHGPDERAHYAKAAWDIEYLSPFGGWKEFEGIHHRGDWDLSRHGKFSGAELSYFDKEAKERYIPWVIETSGGVDRALLFFLLDAYAEEGERSVLKLHPRLAPVKVAVFPLLANKPDLVEKARGVYQALKPRFAAAWDDRGNIGKRYYSQDEIGTPWCVTVDFQTLEDDTVTVRDRDTTKQERVSVAELTAYFSERLKF